MEPGLIAILLLLPFVAVFISAAWQENRRYRQRGRSTYGLTYDPESNTTYVGTIADDAQSYDPEEFDPEHTATSDADDRDTAQTDPAETDADTQDQRT
ncbi:hypothetical protein [Antarctobacter jejuensis]|uniref:hypothetical protein n=1 Tax=Antarctobacter jejuensis TaxID=1439938 RepID=UPI003FD5477C